MLNTGAVAGIIGLCTLPILLVIDVVDIGSVRLKPEAVMNNRPD